MFLVSIASIALLAFAQPKAAVATLQSAKSADAFVDSIGVNTHFDHQNTVYNNNYPLIKDRLSALGVRHIRDHAFLGNDPTFDTKIYSRYRELGSLGIRSTLLLDPRMANQSTVDSAKIAAIAQKAGPALEAFEGPNEYDGSGNSNWAAALGAYQRSLYGAVKGNSTTSNIPVLGPSFVNANNSGQVGDLSASLDYGNLHSYSAGEHPTSTRHFNIDSHYIPNAKKVSGAKPLIATETGYHNAVKQTFGHPGISESAMGKYVPRQYLEYFNRGIKRTYGYEFIDQYADLEKDEQEKNFGLVRNDGTAKPAYTALKNLIDLVEDPGPSFQTKSFDYALSGDTANVHHTLLQKRDGRFYLILWLEKSGYNVDTDQGISVPSQNVNLTLNTQISGAKTYLPNQSTSPIGQYGAQSGLALQVPDQPLVVELTPSSTPVSSTPPVSSAENTAPQVVNLKPANGALVQDRTPTLSANVTDSESALSKSNVRLFVDGGERTGFSYDPATGGLAFTPQKNLKPNTYHSFKIVAQDGEGLATIRESRFKVVS